MIDLGGFRFRNQITVPGKIYAVDIGLAKQPFRPCFKPDPRVPSDKLVGKIFFVLNRVPFFLLLGGMGEVPRLAKKENAGFCARLRFSLSERARTGEKNPAIVSPKTSRRNTQVIILFAILFPEF